jgi:hypothetical protein
MTRRITKRKYRKSCEQIMHERMQENRSRQVEQLFTTLEGQALREFLKTDAAQRERAAQNSR